MEETVKKIYDGFAKRYDQNRGIFDMSSVFESFYGRLNGSGGNLLDLGCGAGEPFDRMFVDRGWSVTGVDFSKPMLEMAAKYVPEMKTLYADMRQARFGSNGFDAAIAVYSLFHLPSADQSLLFEKIHKWLRPGGRLLFTYATMEYTGSEQFDGYKEFMGQQLYYSHRRPDELYSHLRKIGFAVESADYRTIGGETFLWVTAIKPADC